MNLIRFGNFLADPKTGELWREGRRVRLPPQSFQVLLELVRAPGELVTRESLQGRLWPKTSQVEYEQGLNAAINRLRDALGDSAAEPKWVETLPRRGYRFIGQLMSEPTVSPDAAAALPAPLDTSSGTESSPNPSVHAAAMAEIVRSPIRGLRWIVLICGLATLGLVGFLIAERMAPMPEAGRLVPFTALEGEERSPTFSPDGTRIAFAWNGEDAAGRFDLYVKGLDAEQLLRLTNMPAKWMSSAWSPDGKSIAFARLSESATGSGVYVVPAMGGAERRLVAAGFTDAAFMQLSWSPDNKRIAFSSDDGNGTQVMRLIHLDSLNVEPLEGAPECWKAGLPAFSAQGDRLAFVCTTSVGVHGVYVTQLNGEASTQIATIMGDPQGLAWDRDGKSLLIANDSGNGGGLWKLAPEGAMTRLPFGEEGSAPARRGSDIAYVRTRQSVAIWRMDLRSREPAKTLQRLISSTRSDMLAQYSPDGSRIVFQSNRSGSAEIWMAEADGANPVRLTEFNGPLAGAPQWCADGKRIAFDGRTDGSSSIWLMNIEDRKPSKLGGANTQKSLPLWSSDCRFILASDGRRRLYQLSIAGGETAPFTAQDSYLAQAHGGDIVFNVKQPAGVALWSKPMEGAPEAALPGMPLLDYEAAWTVAADGVYYTSTGNGETTLMFYDFVSRQPQRVARLARPLTPGGGLGLAVSPDNRWLLLTQSGETQSDIMLMDNP